MLPAVLHLFSFGVVVVRHADQFVYVWLSKAKMLLHTP
jgi:hypothetical protein